MDEHDKDAPEPEDRPDEPGAEGGSGGSNETAAPAAPSEDDPTPAGDTDQHSDAPA
jgi:hypothetical protein